MGILSQLVGLMRTLPEPYLSTACASGTLSMYGLRAMCAVMGHGRGEWGCACVGGWGVGGGKGVAHYSTTQ